MAPNSTTTNVLVDTPYAPQSFGGVRTIPDADTPLKVKADTNPGSLAKSIVLTLLERPSGVVKVRAMGPGPVNQMVKGLIIARQQLVAQAKDLTYLFGFDTHREGAEDITVIQAVVTLHD